jgi:hypothetical protein
VRTSQSGLTSAAITGSASVRTSQSGLTSAKRTIWSGPITTTVGCGSSQVPVPVVSPIEPPLARWAAWLASSAV